MSDVEYNDFQVAVRARAQAYVTAELLEPVLAEMKARTAPGGGFFKFPSGETSNALELIETDPGNSRGWRWTLRADTPGAFFTNLGEVLTPNQENARGLLSWQGSDGRWYSKKEVDMTKYKDWVRKMFLEVFRERLY